MITLIALIACLYTSDCPRGNECVVDSSGHGYCVPPTSTKRDVTTLMDGARGSFCTFQADCDDGLTCVKQNINAYGICTKEAR
jgi:hypothetical protein